MERKSNRFVRVLIILLSIFLAMLISVSFLLGENRYEITTSIIITALILVVLVLAESFDNFQIGSLLSIQREIKKKDNEISKISNENMELRKQIVSIAVSNNNANCASNYFAFGRDSYPVVTKADESVKEEKAKEDEAAVADIQPSAHLGHVERRSIVLATEKLLISKFVAERKIEEYLVQKEVQFREHFIGIDPIMDRNVSFDAYIKKGQEELFIETKVSIDSPLLSYNLYYLISKVYHYRRASGKNARVILVVPNYDESTRKKIGVRDNNSLQRLYDTFAPALGNELLEVVQYDVSEKDLAGIK